MFILSFSLFQGKADGGIRCGVRTPIFVFLPHALQSIWLLSGRYPLNALRYAGCCLWWRSHIHRHEFRAERVTARARMLTYAFIFIFRGEADGGGTNIVHSSDLLIFVFLCQPLA